MRSDPRVVIAETLQREIGNDLNAAGASYDDLQVSVSEDRGDATPFGVNYSGLSNFKSADGTIFNNSSGEFIMAYIGGGQYRGSLAGTQFTVSVGKVDNIDLPFINDPDVIGEWKSVDFVAEKSEFDPNLPKWKGDLYWKGLTFLENGKTLQPWFTWTKGVVIHHGDKTASHYEIQKINGQRYLFMEFKTGDYTILGKKPMYYVMRWSGNTAFPSSAPARPPRPLAARVSSETAGKLRQWVEDFFHHNYRDITDRKTLEWGEPETTALGNLSIRYKFDAVIWGKDILTMNQVFIFTPDGNFVSVKNVDGFPVKRGVVPPTTRPAVAEDKIEDALHQWVEQVLRPELRRYHCP